MTSDTVVTSASVSNLNHIGCPFRRTVLSTEFVMGVNGT